MAFTKTFPVDIGTLVITDHKDVDLSQPGALLGRLGTISCYQCVTNKAEDYIVMVSGYKDSWCGEYLLSNLLIATNEQVAIYKKEMGINFGDNRSRRRKDCTSVQTIQLSNHRRGSSGYRCI